MGGRGRRALVRSGAAVVLSMICSAGNAVADPTSPRDQPQPVLLTAVRVPASLLMVEPAVHDRGAAAALLRSESSRPRALGGLYVGFAALQALDAHSTITAVRAGHREANPLIRPFAHRPGVLIAAKAATAAGTIALSERLWRKHRAAAVLLMVAANAGYAAVVAHNYRQARR
jgi:hypothetical protein